MWDCYLAFFWWLQGLTVPLVHALHRPIRNERTFATKLKMLSQPTPGDHTKPFSHLQSAFVAPLCCVVIDLVSNEIQLLLNSHVDLNSMLSRVTSISSADELLNAALKALCLLHEGFLWTQRPFRDKTLAVN